MKIGRFEVGDFRIKESAGKRKLTFACRDCPYSASVSDDQACRYHVLHALQELEADLIVLAEVYERVYNEDQTKMLAEISALIQKFSAESIWSYSHLGDPNNEDESVFGARHDIIVRITHDLLSYDPIAAYFTCLQEVKKETSKIEELKKKGEKPAEIFLKNLKYILKSLEGISLIKQTKKYIAKLKEVPNAVELYKIFFEAEIKPSFIGARLTFGEEEKLGLLDEYQVKEANVQIFEHPDKTEKLYFVNTPEYTLPPDKYFILSKAREIVASYRPGKTSLSTVAKSRKYFERVYQSTISDIAKRNNISIKKDEVEQLAGIVARYTVGYGILEILLSDRKITDIYLDSPIGGKPLYIVHSDYGQCETNILYTEDEAEALVSKMRAMSGRPFDEAHPVLDLDLEDMDTRTAVIGPPLSPDGIAFAFRLHKLTPWTLPQFIDNSFLTPLAAGLLSFFVTNQSTMLVCGSRGAGKTSLAGSLLLEIMQNTRMLIQEDTLEMPVPYMKEIGFNVQRLKTRSPIQVSKTEAEVAPEEALRTALRLGDSALIIGEVRSKEAKVLYEAMRIGAAGNVVLGTIHADSAYAVWDRVVNDLEVPTTSFKATDLVVVARPIRFGGSLKRHRRVVQLTEVKKHWTEDPEREGGLLDLMAYDARKDELELLEDNIKESELFTKISRLSGMSFEEIWDEIKMIAESKNHLVELKRKYNIPKLLEAENTVFANNKLLLLREKQLEDLGYVDRDLVLGEWKNWVKGHLLKKFVKK